MSKHDEMVSKIFYHPNIISLDDIIISVKEPLIFNNSGNNVIGSPDILAFDPSTRTLYNIEYKTTNHQRKKAMNQLNKTHLCLKKVFNNYKIVDLYVHNNYEVEKI